MSDENNIDIDGENDTQLVKDLRAQIKALTAKHAAAEAEIATFKTQARSTSIADILKARGAKPAIAKFISDDIEATDEAITKWLEDNGEVFGYDPKAAPVEANPGTNTASTAPALNQFQIASQTEAQGEQIALVGLDKHLSDLNSLKGKGFEAVEAFLTGTA